MHTNTQVECLPWQQSTACAKRMKWGPETPGKRRDGATPAESSHHICFSYRLAGAAVCQPRAHLSLGFPSLVPLWRSREAPRIGEWKKICGNSMRDELRERDKTLQHLFLFIGTFEKRFSASRRCVCVCVKGKGGRGGGGGLFRGVVWCRTDLWRWVTLGGFTVVAAQRVPCLVEYRLHYNAMQPWQSAALKWHNCLSNLQGGGWHRGGVEGCALRWSSRSVFPSYSLHRHPAPFVFSLLLRGLSLQSLHAAFQQSPGLEFLPQAGR